MKKQRCYIYTRVSTDMQVDGFSLDAQKEKLKKYADYQDMVVIREFSFPVKNIDTYYSLKYYYHNVYERISFMFVFVIGNTYVTTTTTCNMTAYGPIGI